MLCVIAWGQEAASLQRPGLGKEKNSEHPSNTLINPEPAVGAIRPSGALGRYQRTGAALKATKKTAEKRRNSPFWLLYQK